MPTAQKALVRIFTQLYLGEWYFNEDMEHPSLLYSDKKTPAVDCSRFKWLDDQSHYFVDPTNLSKEKNLGMVYYTLVALKLAEKRQKLYSDSFAENKVNQKARALWDDLVLLELAKVTGGDDRYEFLVPEKADLQALKDIAQTRARRVKAGGAIASVLEEIHKKLRKPKSGCPLKS